MLLDSDPVVRTVCGDIAASWLEHTQCHEHIWLENGPSKDMNPALLMDDFGRSLEELKAYAAAGGSAIVDAQPGGFGGNGAILQQLSRDSGVKIIAVTGFHRLIYLEAQDSLLEQSVGELTKRFIFDLKYGLRKGVRDETRLSAKAGIVKVALEPDAFENAVYKRLFQAAAEAAMTVGAPVLVHTETKTDILKLVRYFERLQIPANRLIVCHLDRTCPDPEYHRQVLAAGCYLCYDSIQRIKYITQEQELALIECVCDSGYERQLLLSLDTTNQRLHAYHGQDMGLDYILTKFIPMLKASGISAERIGRMCIENAQNALQLKG